MIPVFLTTILSCSQIFSTINKLQSVAGLTQQQKVDIITELRKVVPSCPVVIQKDDRQTKTRN